MRKPLTQNLTSKSTEAIFNEQGDHQEWYKHGQKQMKQLFLVYFCCCCKNWLFGHFWGIWIMISLIDNDRRWMMIFAPPLVHKLQTLPEGQRTQAVESETWIIQWTGLVSKRSSKKIIVFLWAEASLNCNGVLKRCFIAHLKMRTHLELLEEEVSLC